MAIEVHPVDGDDVNELEWSKMARLWLPSGVDGTPAGTELKCSVGVGRTINVAPGAGWVRGFRFVSDATEYVELPANASGNPRVDRVVARMELSTHAVTFGYVEGTPAATPVGPDVTLDDVTGVYELSLGIGRVVSGGTTISALSDTRRFVGRPMVPCSSNNRPSLDGRPIIAYETDTKRVITNAGSGAWNVGFGDETYRPITVYSLDDGTTSSTSYTSSLSGTSSPTITTTFTAPASGNVMVRIGGNLQTSTSNAYVKMTVRITQTSGGAVVVADDSLLTKFNSNTGSGQSGASCSAGRVFTLTPGTGYTATLRYLSSSGAATIDDRQLEVWPLP